MSVVEDVLKIALKHVKQNNAGKLISVMLRVGEMRDVVDEWMQRYFDFLSRGTVAEGAKLIIERTPILFRCACGELFPVGMTRLQENSKVLCPACNGSENKLFSGREFEVIEIEVQ